MLPGIGLVTILNVAVPEGIEFLICTGYTVEKGTGNPVYLRYIQPKQYGRYCGTNERQVCGLGSKGSNKRGYKGDESKGRKGRRGRGVSEQVPLSSLVFAIFDRLYLVE